MDAREACDDGNGAGGDGCEPDCSVTKGWNCTTAGADCGLEVRAEEVGDRLCGPSACVYVPVCGDGARNLEGEECDDGNVRGGDGCAHNCTVELSWRCEIARSGRDQCSPVVVTDRSRFDQALCPVCGDPAWSRCVLYGGEGKCRCGPGFVKSGFTRALGGAEGCPASGSDCDPAGYTNPFLTTAEAAFPTRSPRSTVQRAPEPRSDSTPQRPAREGSEPPSRAQLTSSPPLSAGLCGAEPVRGAGRVLAGGRRDVRRVGAVHRHARVIRVRVRAGLRVLAGFRDGV